MQDDEDADILLFPLNAIDPTFLIISKVSASLRFNEYINTSVVIKESQCVNILLIC